MVSEEVIYYYSGANEDRIWPISNKRGVEHVNPSTIVKEILFSNSKLSEILSESMNGSIVREGL